LVSLRNDLFSHTFLNLENDLLAFCILELTSLLVPPFRLQYYPSISNH
jgi:hypothetical protein